MEQTIILNVISTVASMIFGGLITGLVAKHYYVRASKDLINETNALRHQVVMVLRAMENAGLAKLNRDGQGNVIGLRFDVSCKEAMIVGDGSNVKISGL